jgi:hypothetical protein
MTKGNKPSISSSIGGHEEVKRLEKWDTKEPPIAALSESQIPSSDFKKFMAFDLLLMMVEEWKNFVFRSLQVSQFSLDFDLQRISSFNKRSSSSVLRICSLEKERKLGGVC